MQLARRYTNINFYLHKKRFWKENITYFKLMSWISIYKERLMNELDDLS